MRPGPVARRGWVRAHQALGIALGAWLVVVGLTGSALVFYLDLDRVLRPRTRPGHALDGEVPVVRAQAVLEALRARYPERTGAWRIELPMSAQDPVRARYPQPVERAGALFAPFVATLDPATLRISSEGFWGDDPMTWLYDLHYALLLDRPGRAAVGIAGLVAMLSLASGLVLWWPARGQFARAVAPRWRPGRVRRVYDLHTLGGVWAGGLLLVLTATGAALALPDQTRWLLGVVPPGAAVAPPAVHASAATSAARAEPAAIASPRGDVPLDLAMARARDALGGGEVRWVETPAVPGHDAAVIASPRAIGVRIHRDGDPGRRFPHARVWIDAQTGAVLRVHDPRAHGDAGGTVLAWLHPLHSGEAFGLAGRWLVLATGISCALLAVTGAWRWIDKRNARRRARDRGARDALAGGPRASVCSSLPDGPRPSPVTAPGEPHP